MTNEFIKIMQAPKLPSFIKINKNKKFEMFPRYYDERKERLEKLKEKYKQSEKEDVLTKDNLKKRWIRNRKLTDKASSYSTIRLVVIMMILFAVAYYILNMNLEKFIGE